MSEPRNIITLTFVFVLFLATCGGESSEGENEIKGRLEPWPDFQENMWGTYRGSYL